MKKTFYILSGIIFCFLAFFTACEDDDRDSLNLAADTLIHNFEINGVDGTIDNTTMTIEILMPPMTDLSQLAPTVTIAEGATITPASGERVDFSSGAVEYTVTNGDVYNIYKVTADVVKGQITKFTINNKNGVIDQVNNKIHVVLPTSTLGTSFAPVIEFTEGATISPASGETVDFASPVTYTLSYAGATFTYEVSVEKSDDAFAFVGVAATMNGLTDPDELTAAEWMMNNIPNSQYISFDQIKSGAVNLSDFNVVWWHYDSAQSLPPIAGDVAVVNAFKTYYQNGGNLFLSTFAGLFVANLGITANSSAPNNTFGDAVPFPAATTERWGISIAGNETHPIYANLDIDNSEGYAIVYMAGIGAVKHNNSCIWNLEVEPYNNVTNWSTMTGGTSLGSLNWDSDCSKRVAVSEYPGVDGGKGTVICIGGGSYDWYSEEGSTNSYIGNIRQFTQNVFNYLNE